MGSLAGGCRPGWHSPGMNYAGHSRGWLGRKAAETHATPKAFPLTALPPCLQQPSLRPKPSGPQNSQPHLALLYELSDGRHQAGEGRVVPLLFGEVLAAAKARIVPGKTRGGAGLVE
jgi:hypothetical protein